jgi:hypothetical protein
MFVVGALPAIALLVTAAAAAAGITASAFDGRSEVPAAPFAASAGVPLVDDLTHVKEVRAYLNGLTSPITPPLVYSMGDSTTRESVVSEAKWAAEVLRLGGPEVQPYVLAMRNQTFPLDRVVADGLPSEPAVVLIGVGLSRFTNAPSADPTLGEPLDAAASLSPWRQHRYSAADMLTAAEKRAEVKRWLTRRYPLFKQNRAANLAMLRALVQACRQRGWQVALVDMSVNKAVVGDAFDAPIDRYRADCTRLAREEGIRYLRFTSVVSGKSANFRDLIHLVGNGPTGGRTRWQVRLAAEVAKLLTAQP